MSDLLFGFICGFVTCVLMFAAAGAWCDRKRRRVLRFRIGVIR